jgi:hypothetical protein
MGVLCDYESCSSPLNTHEVKLVNVQGGGLVLPCTNTPTLGDTWCTTCTELYTKDQSLVEKATGVPIVLISTVALTPRLAADEEVAQLTLKQLQTHLRAAGLPTSGLKPELLKRLHAHRAEGRANGDTDDHPVDQAGGCVERTPRKPAVLPPKRCTGLTGVRKLGRTLQYQVQWVGPAGHKTWEAARCIEPTLLAEYHASTVRESTI